MTQSRMSYSTTLKLNQRFITHDEFLIGMLNVNFIYLYFTHKVKRRENLLKILKNASIDLEMVQKCKKN